MQLLIERSQVQFPGRAKKCFIVFLIIEMLNESPELGTWDLLPPYRARKAIGLAPDLPGLTCVIHTPVHYNIFYIVDCSPLRPSVVTKIS